MMKDLSREERLRLMRFLCSFAWADLEVHAKEQAFVTKMVTKLKLESDEAALVKGWLKVPPPPEEVDPSTVPAEHRRLFLDTVRDLIAADGKLQPEEQEAFALLEALMR
jgi:uncharacterized tellurite resistance protein B-like protein